MELISKLNSDSKKTPNLPHAADSPASWIWTAAQLSLEVVPTAAAQHHNEFSC